MEKEGKIERASVSQSESEIHKYTNKFMHTPDTILPFLTSTQE